MGTLSPFPWDLSLSRQNGSACEAAYTASLHSGTSLGAQVASLRCHILRRGSPKLTESGSHRQTQKSFCTYYGSEFASRIVEAWAMDHDVRLCFIRPGRPVENGLIESFNERLRDECLNVSVFFSLADVRQQLQRWQRDYNQWRPHSSLDDRTPNEFARV